MYLALYRKYRPRTFSDVAGQKPIVQTLRNQIKENRHFHAYLFTGSRGTGKTTCAKILAKAVNCLNPKDGDPCNECEACKAIDDGSVITNYLNSKNERVASQIGFELDIIDDREEVPVIYKAFAMNDVFSSSLNFGDRINTYDIVMPFYFNGDKYVYSMYSAKDDVNVEPLCTALGGGGHQHAAGFTSKTLDISRGGALIIKNKE